MQKVEFIELQLHDLGVEIESKPRTIKIEPDKLNDECTFGFYVELGFLFKTLAWVSKTLFKNMEIAKATYTVYTIVLMMKITFFAYKITGSIKVKEDSMETINMVIKIFQLEAEGEYAVEFKKTKVITIYLSAKRLMLTVL